MGSHNPPQLLDRARRLKQFGKDTGGQAAFANIGGVVVLIIAGILVPIVAMDVLSSTLPDYFTSLSSLFTSLAAVNTTGWPPVVATIFGFVDLILGVTAIAAVLGLGAFLVIRARRSG